MAGGAPRGLAAGEMGRGGRPLVEITSPKGVAWGPLL